MAGGRPAAVTPGWLGEDLLFPSGRLGEDLLLPAGWLGEDLLLPAGWPRSCGVGPGQCLPHYFGQGLYKIRVVEVHIAACGWHRLLSLRPKLPLIMLASAYILVISTPSFHPESAVWLHPIVWLGGRLVSAWGMEELVVHIPVARFFGRPFRFQVLSFGPGQTLLEGWEDNRLLPAGWKSVAEQESLSKLTWCYLSL